MALNHRQQLFVKYYLIEQNGTEAALKAGYCKTRNSAAQQATDLLKKPEIRKIIDDELARRIGKVDEVLQRHNKKYEAEDVLRGLQEIADCDISKCYLPNGDLKPIHQIPKSVRKAIAGIDTVTEVRKVGGKQISVKVRKLRFWDKTKALELSGKHMKLFTERREVTGANGAPLVPQQQFVVILPAKDAPAVEPAPVIEEKKE